MMLLMKLKELLKIKNYKKQKTNWKILKIKAKQLQMKCHKRVMRNLFHQIYHK